MNNDSSPVSPLTAGNINTLGGRSGQFHLADAAERAPAGIRFIGDLARVQVQPGDFFVLSCNEELPQESISFIHNQFKTIAGEVPLLVLGKGMSLEVLDRTRALAKLDRAEDAAKKE